MSKPNITAHILNIVPTDTTERKSIRIRPLRKGDDLTDSMATDDAHKIVDWLNWFLPCTTLDEVLRLMTRI